MESIVNLEVLYVSSLSGFGPGKWLRMYGTVPAEGFRFTINLQCGVDVTVQGDVALQITVSLLDNNISVNSMRRGIWDEAQTNLGVPIKKEERFELSVTCDFTQYKIFINGEHYFEFPQRIAYDRITHVAINGDVSIQQIIHQSGLPAPTSTAPPPPPSCNEVQSIAQITKLFSDLWSKVPFNYGTSALSSPTPGMPPYPTGTQSVAAVPGYQPHPVQPAACPTQKGTLLPLNAASSNFHPQVPYLSSLSGFGPGKWLKMYGTVPAEAFTFTINLQCAVDVTVQGDVALQITVSLLDNNVLVNSMRRGIWDEAQTILGVPIKKEERFELSVTCDFTQYKIFINGEHYFEFPQRIAYDRITHVAINGDVSIQQIIHQSGLPAPTSTGLPAPTSTTPPPPIGFKQAEASPPSCNEVQSKAQITKLFSDLWSKVPFNYGTCALPSPTPGMPAYSTGTQFVAAVPGYQPHPVQSAAYPTQTGTLLPLNAASSNFRPVSPSKRKKYSTYASALFIIFIIVFSIFSRINQNP